MPKNLIATPILDYRNSEVRAVSDQIVPDRYSSREIVQEAHRRLLAELRPVYSVRELQSASQTLRAKQGSCSQRMACLEAIARACGVGTRVHALWVDRRFWYPRFGWLRPLIPRRILLVWPQFFTENGWLDFDELYDSIRGLVSAAPQAFTNDGESLFEAVRHTPVDLFGKSCASGEACSADLSRFVVASEGLFDTRDEVFAKFGSIENTIRGKAFEVLFGGRSIVPFVRTQ